MPIINFDDHKDRLPHLGRRGKGHEKEFSNLGIEGWSPYQLYDLLYSDWEKPDSPIRINTDISLETLQSCSKLFRQARDFLLLVQEKAPVKATAKKNLTRRFVAELMDALLTKQECDSIREWNKAINEFDVPRIDSLRVVLEVAGLIQLRKGSFYIVKKRQHLLKPDNAGSLFKRLFIVFFQKFNIDYMAMYGERLGSIQEGKYEEKEFGYPAGRGMSACRTTPFFSQILEFAFDESEKVCFRHGTDCRFRAEFKIMSERGSFYAKRCRFHESDGSLEEALAFPVRIRETDGCRA